MTTPAEREFAEGVAAWTPPWARTPEPPAPTEAPVEASATGGADEVADPAVGLPHARTPERVAPTDVDPTDDAPSEGSGPDVARSEGPGSDVAQFEAGEDATQSPDPDNAPLDPVELRPALEAILLVVDEPVAEIVLAQVLEQPTQLITDTLVDLAASYAAERRGFELRRAAGGWRLYTRPDFAPYVEKFVLDGQQTKLTQAALETLAVVAYKQPVTRGRVSAIRGVNCDGVLRTLLTRGLVEECGSEPDSGAYLYRTTTLFLEKLGINSPEDLPSLAPYLPDDIEALADAHDQS
ncbi:SMC-Scp complex subunit ScpB [Longispora sp. K20-0274]|uniref:SMC-Scp complex subunit ScpB n=1 Tax=Longispora sp. K20-0274 TaxID=3088255 RepID=UPI003999B4B4